MPLFHGNALGVELRPGADLRRHDRAAAPVLRVGVPRRRAPRRRDVLQHGRAARSSYVLATPPTADDRTHRVKFALAPESSPTDVDRVPRALRHPARRRLRLERGRDHHHAGTRRQAGRARRAPAGADVAVVDPETGAECPRARVRRARPAAERRATRSARSCGATAASSFEGYYNNPEATPSAAATAGTGRATSATATTTASSTSPGRDRRLAPRRRRELRRRADRAHPRPSSRRRARSPCTPCPTRSPATR